MDHAAREIEVLGTDDYRTWTASRESIHRSRPEVRHPVHAGDAGVTEDGAHQDRLQLRADNVDHREITHRMKVSRNAPALRRMRSRSVSRFA